MPLTGGILRAGAWQHCDPLMSEGVQGCEATSSRRLHSSPPACRREQRALAVKRMQSGGHYNFLPFGARS